MNSAYVVVNHYSLADVARILGVRDYQIKYAEHQGHVPKPRQVGGSRVYLDADLEVLRQFYANRPPRINK